MNIITVCLGLVLATRALGAEIPMTEFPLKNAANSRDVYRMVEHPNTVFVFEAYSVLCGTCNENAKAVDELAEDYRANDRVQVIDLGLDQSDAEYREWIRRHHPNHPVVQDVGRRVFNALKTTSGTPQVFVVNCHGYLLGSRSGVWEAGDKEKIRRMINAGLEVDCP